MRPAAGPMRWGSEIALGIPELDDQHKEIIEKINRLHAALGARSGDVAAAFNALIGIAVRHFATEERYMKESGYPHLARHRQEHTELLRAVNHHYEDYLEGRIELGRGKVEEFLVAWVKQHTSHSDLDYIPYVKAAEGL